MTTDPNELADRLTVAAALESDDAALRFLATYEPAAGPGAKVFPPSYATERRGESVYATEHRYLGGDEAESTTLLAAVQDNANRVELALKRALESGDLELPTLELEFFIKEDGQEVRRTLSSLEAPHRSRDAYYRDSMLGDVPFDDSEVGRALAAATTLTAAPFVEHSPVDIVLGTWDSHRGRRRPTRFARVYASEMFGVAPHVGRRGGGRMDPFVLMKDDQLDLKAWGLSESKARTKMSEIGHGMVPASLNPASFGEQMAAGGGVSVREIRRSAMLSFVGLNNVSTGMGDAVDRSVRGLLAGLAVLGDRLAFGGPAISLRSGCDLVQLSDQIAWVRRGGVEELIEISRDVALSTFNELLARARSAGIRWDAAPVVLTPKTALQAALEAALTTVDVTASQD